MGRCNDAGMTDSERRGGEQGPGRGDKQFGFGIPWSADHSKVPLSASNKGNNYRTAGITPCL